MVTKQTDIGMFEQIDDNGHSEDAAEMLHGSKKRQLGIRPTLFVGLGGTGQRVGVHLKAQFQARGGIPDWLRLVVFDTADEPTVVRLEDGQTVSLEPGTEFVNIGRVPVGRIIRHSKKQRAIAERFGESLERLPPTVLRHGAKQVRLLGLLALYWHFHEVEEHLQRAIWHLAGRETGRQTVVDTGQGINIFVVNSLCGGTGAGTFLDVAFLVRALVGELGDLGDFCQVTGIGVLPGAFPGVDGPCLLPNTVASLMELNRAMTHGDFCAVYPNGRIIEPSSAPFNLYYVIDGVDERGRVWQGINAVCQLAARALYIQMGSQLGRKGENDFDNLDEVLSNVGEDGAGTFLGSVGLSVCNFDAHLAQAHCARRQATRLIREGWLRDAGKDTAPDRAESFWETNRLVVESLQTDLAMDDEGIPIRIDLALPGSVRRLPASQQARETVAYVEEYRNARLEGTFQAAIEKRRRERTAALTSELRRQVAQLAGDPEIGVHEAQATLAALQFFLKTARQALEGRQEEWENQLGRLEKDLDRHKAALLRSRTSGLLARGRRIGAAQRRYLQAATNVYRMHLSHSVDNAALQVLDSLAALRGELENTLNRLSDRLRDAVQLLAEAPAVSGDGLLVDLELADAAYVSQLYERYAPGLGDTGALCLAGDGDLLAWADRPAAELARWIEREAAQPFERLLQHDVESALQEQANEASPEARRQWLLQRATPSWNLDRSRMDDGGAGLVSVTVLGVPDEHNSLFAEQSETLVSTQDRQRVIAFRATVGAPYTALQQFRAWARAYQQMRGRRPLHVLPAFHTSLDTAYQAFALGLVFKLVSTQGSWYYYRPTDRLDEEVRLAQGLNKAVRVFASQEGLAHELMERVEQHIQVNLTLAQAIEQLDAYYTAGEEGNLIDETDRALRKAARTYADKLRQVLAASEGISSG
jgi:hypothetical protein